MSTANTYFKGEIETFGAVLALRYGRVDLKNYFDVFHEKLINYTIKEINNAEVVLMLIQDLMYPKSLVYFKNKPNDPTIEEAKSEVNKAILAARVRQYIEQEARIYLNMNKIYGII